MLAHLFDVKTTLGQHLEIQKKRCDVFITPILKNNGAAAAMKLINTWQYLPESFRYAVILHILNHFFDRAFKEGELAHLVDRSLSLKLKETEVIYHFKILETEFEANDQLGESCVSATLKAFIGLASKSLDPDALFFNRELIIEGDTDLGLEIKHLIDNLDIPAPLKAGFKALSERL